MASAQAPVVILGAGLTGMSAAYHLGARGIPYRLLERLDRVGGHAVTREERGYRFDCTGHLLHVEDEQIRQLALACIGPQHRQIRRRAMVFSHGVYTRYPFQANVHGLPPQVAYDCVMGFLQAREAWQQGRTPPPKSFEEHCLAHFGRGISEHFMIPYNSRCWGVAPQEISADWCERFVPRPSLEDVIAGAVGLCDRELGYNRSFIYPLEGIGQLSLGLGAQLAGIELEREVDGIDTARRRLQLGAETMGYDILISTMPLPRLIALCRDAPAAVTAAARRLRCTELHYLDVALRRPCGQPYHWVYVPEPRFPFYRVGCYSHFSPQMAPPGKASLYVELVSRAAPDLGRLLPEVAAGLCELGFIEVPEDIVFARPRRLEHAYVIFDHHCYPALATIRPFLAERGILSIGRYGGWSYSSMADALGFGRDAAADAAAALLNGVIPG